MPETETFNRPSPVTYENPERLPDFKMKGVNGAMEKIERIRLDEAEHDTDWLYQAGIAWDGTLISVLERKTAPPDEDRYIVCTGETFNVRRDKILDDAFPHSVIKPINIQRFKASDPNVTGLADGGLAFNLGDSPDGPVILTIPSEASQAKGNKVEFWGDEVIPLQPVPAEAVNTEEQELKEMIKMNFGSIKKILGDHPTAVRDAQTGRQMTRGVVRQIAFDAPSEAPITPGYFNSGIYETTVGDTEDLYYTVRYKARDQRGRFTGQHCVALINPTLQESYISTLDQESNAYTEYEPMTAEDHYQLRLSLFGVYQEALDDKNVDGRRIWPGFVVTDMPQ